MNKRQERANQMVESIDSVIVQLDEKAYRIKSQTNPNQSYVVKDTVHGLVCECPDHQTRRSDCKHIKVAIEFIKKNNGVKNTPFRIIDKSKLNICKFCDSGNIKKMGFRDNKRGRVQRMGCKDCKKRFVTNYGFERMRNDPILITRAMQMYYSKMSSRRIADCFEQEEVEISYRSIYNWISKYSKISSDYLNTIVPGVGD